MEHTEYLSAKISRRAMVAIMNRQTTFFERHGVRPTVDEIVCQLLKLKPTPRFKPGRKRKAA
jgi:hypothetical protein